MKKLSLMLFIAAGTAFISCDKKQAENVAPETEATAADSASTEVPVIESRQNQDAQAVIINSESSEEANQVAQNSGKPALNPPHGEPYHRCDIAVGAPIDSPAPVQNQPTVVQQQNTAVNFDTNPIGSGSASANQNSGPKPSVNPPHGEPYHRCDIQVGAPLI